MIVLSKECCNHVRIKISIESDDDDMMRMLYNANVKKWRVLSFEGLKTKDIVYSIEVDGGQLRMLWACKGVSKVSYSIFKKKISAKRVYEVFRHAKTSYFVIQNRFEIWFIILSTDIYIYIVFHRMISLSIRSWFEVCNALNKTWNQGIYIRRMFEHPSDNKITCW